MKACIYEAPGALLKVTDVPEPKAGPGELVVRVKNCGVCGSDLHAVKYGFNMPAGTIMGHEFSGVLEGWGPDFPARDVYGQDLRPGDAVAVGTTLSCGTCYYCRFVPQRENLCQNVNIYGITMGCDVEPFVRGGYAG